MYIVEFIHKKNVYENIIENWWGMGHHNKNPHGFYFELEYLPLIRDGVVYIDLGDRQYYYNLLDFYRVKVTRA